MSNKLNKVKSKNSKGNYGWYGVLVVLLLLGGVIGVWLLLVAVGAVDNPFEEKGGYAGSGISERDWFDGDLCWTVYAHPDDTTVTVELPKDDFIIEEHIHYDEFNSSNITEFGGFIALWAETEDPEDWDSAMDAIRILIVLYGNLEDSEYDCSDLWDLINEVLELTDEWETHSDSGGMWVVNDHGEQEVTLKKAENETEQMIGMYASVCYLCDQNDRTYSLFYGVAKNSTLNDWSDTAFQAEAKYVFESFTCHD